MYIINIYIYKPMKDGIPMEISDGAAVHVEAKLSVTKQ